MRDYLLIVCLCFMLLAVSATAETITSTVTIDPSVRYQVIEGFGEGGMDTFIPIWYNRFHTVTLEGILDSLYTLKDDGLGLNICRFLMPMGDDPEHKHFYYIPPIANKPFEPEDGVFKWDGHEDILWHAEGAQKRGAKMLAGWYSIPYWLTVSGCTGGSEDGKSDNLIAGKEKRFVKHMVDVLKHFRDEWKIDFDYVSPVNESEANWWKSGGGSPGSHISAPQTINIVRELDKQLKQNKFDTKIQAHDAAYANYYWYLDKLLESDIEPLFSTITFHQYITGPPHVLDVWPDRAKKHKKSLWMTEWGDWQNAGYPDDKPYVQAMNYANKMHEALKVAKVNAWIIWEPAFLFNEKAFTVSKRKAFWAVAHYTRHLKPGMVQIESKASNKNCKTTTWIDPNGQSLVIVTVNSGKEDMLVKYDMSAFASVKVQQVRLTSADKDYSKESNGETIDRKLSHNAPAGSIMTVSVELSK